MALSNRYDALSMNTKGLESTEGLPLVVEIIPGTAGDSENLFVYLVQENTTSSSPRLRASASNCV